MLINCPECGKEVSDKAPYCPHCGIEIAAGRSQEPAEAPARPPMREPEQKNSHKWVWILSLLLAVIACGVVFYFYSKAKNEDEIMQYEVAAQSDDAEILQSFLDNYRDAPRAHRDDIQRKLSDISRENREWNDAVLANTREALTTYMREHPESAHKDEALAKIDSIDWNNAKTAETVEAVKEYLKNHVNGEFADEAKALIDAFSALIVKPEEQAMIHNLFKKFFQSINAQQSDRLTSTVTSLLTTFLGKSDATPNDVISFMKRLWRDDVQNLNWHIIDDYKIDKKDTGNGEYEYSVTFSATQDVQKATGMTEKKYRIKAKVSPDGRISEFNMSKAND